jgi:hypothetical protein
MAGRAARGLPARRVVTPAGLYDLVRPGAVVVLAPRWANALAPAGDAHLPRDGFVVLVAPPGVRRLAAGALGRGGWAVRQPLLAVPGPHAPGYIATLGSPHAARIALAHQGAGGSRTRRLTALALRLPGGKRALRTFSPRTALLLARPGGPRAFSWLDPDVEAISVTAGRHAGAVVRGWRAGAAGPVALAKVDPGGRLDREAGALARLGPAAAAAGAALPRVRDRVDLGGHTALVEDVVGGEPARAVLARDPARLAGVLAALGGWLLRWNAATRVEHELTADELERWLLAPARRLTADAAPLAERFAGTRVPLVAVHRDLTTDNLLLAGDALGIVDWEHADAAWLPFTDLAYAAVDAIAVARRLPRAEALAALRRDPPAAWREHRAAFGREIESLALHACFLHHAANELGEPGGGDGQFAAAAHALLRGGAG